ncbi:MAG: nucleoside kinase [Acidobacteria bacterium]|nr:MAG: nucleoside kinase [Acidobacteriota bacterium]RLE32293.1 MAG: nucleoside kinase [Acidobacteriota bacterium]
MNESIVRVRYRGEDHSVSDGTRVDQFLTDVDGEIEETVLAALVNRRKVMLDFPLRGRVDLELVRFGDREGESVYKRSVCLLFHEACAELYPEAGLIVGQSLGNCYHYQVRGEFPQLKDMARKIKERMTVIRDEARPFIRRTVTVEELEDYFRRESEDDKLDLLGTRRSSTIPTISCGTFIDIAHGPFVPDTSCLPTFGVQPFGDGLVLRFPRRSDRQNLPPFTPRELLFKTYVETRHWQELLGVQRVGQLNQICLDGDVRHLVRVAEGLHEKKISRIADEIYGRLPGVKLVTIAGPSSSGKTTFSKRLGIQLRVNGVEPVALSLDNYYVNRSETPVDEDGKPDFESIEAIDLPMFHEQLGVLMEGGEVRTPRFDFVTGLRVPERQWVPMRLKDGQVLVIEGIHGLNPRLTTSIPEDRIFRVYVSALSQLAIDDHNRIFTSDTRLTRRIVRDHLFRGFTAERTLDMWERVRRGEGKWIFPFQEQADVMFDSALVYEPAVLKVFAERFLLQVPRSSPTYTEAYRLLKGLSMLVPVFPDEVPHTSLLREFIGGSTFRE